MQRESTPGLPLAAEATRTIGLLGAVLAIGGVDYWSGPLYGFALFYLIPVVVAAWYLTRQSAVIVAAASALVWVAADIGQLGVEHLTPSSWNGFTRLVIFVGAALLVSGRKRDKVELEQRASRAIDEREKARQLAVTDPLTGLFNRNFLEEEAARLHAAARQEGTSYSLIAIDVDNLKLINDSAGHDAGDQALRRLSDLIRAQVRRWDVPVRIGGDEFLVLLPDATEGEATKIAARIDEGVTRSLAASGMESISIGVATWRPEQSFTDTLVEADRRMYDGKSAAKRRRAANTDRLRAASPGA